MPAASSPSPRGRPRAAALGVLAACLLASPPAPAKEPNFHFTTALWQSRLGGDGSTTPGGSNASFDWDSTLGLDTKEVVSTFEAFLRVRGSRFILGIEHGKYEGDKTLSRDLVYNGVTFPAGGKLETELDFKRRRVLYGGPLVEDERLAIGYLIGLDAYEMESKPRMDRPIGPGGQEVDLQSKVPVVGASLTFYPTARLRLYAQLAGMSIDRGGVDSRMLTGYGVAEYTILSEYVAIAFGYRYSSLESSDDTENAELKMEQQGPYAGLTLRF